MGILRILFDDSTSDEKLQDALIFLQSRGLSSWIDETPSEFIQHGIHEDIPPPESFQNKEKLSSIFQVLEQLVEGLEKLSEEDLHKLFKKLHEFIVSIRKLLQALSSIDFLTTFLPSIGFAVEIAETLLLQLEKALPHIAKAAFTLVPIISSLLLRLLHRCIGKLQELSLQGPSTIQDSEDQVSKKALIEALVVILGSISCAAIFPAIATVLISLLGFTTAGIAGGSVAAALMSACASASGGAVGVGSIVAILQSAGVIGFGAAATGGLALIGGLIPVIGFIIYKIVDTVKENERKDQVLQWLKRIELGGLRGKLKRIGVKDMGGLLLVKDSDLDQFKNIKPIERRQLLLEIEKVRNIKL